MLQRVSIGWQLAQQSYEELKRDKELVLFPLFSGIACILVLASFLVPLWASGVPEAVMDDQPIEPQQQIIGYALLFAFYVVSYFIIIFCNSALIACAIIRFKGGNPGLGDGFAAALTRLPQIFGWALVAATVGLVLKAIENRSERVGHFVAGLLGMAWSAVTYFVVPVIVVEKLGPIGAARRSLDIVKKTWGEALSANFGIGLVVFFASLVAFIPLALGAVAIASDMIPLGIVGVVCGVVALLIVSLIASTLNAIILAALYLYAAEGSVPKQFNEELFQQAFAHK